MLLERARELDVVDAALADVGDGHGKVLLVRAGAGIGKTMLLAEIGERCAAASLDVLTSAASEFEADLGFAVVRDLLAPSLATSPLVETAALAAPVFEPSATGAIGDLASVFHGLLAAVAGLARERSVALLVDDVHWADESSWRFLVYLARRLEALPVLLVMAMRPDEPGSPVREFPAGAHVQTLTPAPLSSAGVDRLLRHALPFAPDRALTKAAVDLTGGNPFLLREVAGAIAHEGARSASAAVSILDGVAPAAVARSVLVRLGRMDAACAALARAVAALPPPVPLRHAATVAGLQVGEAARAATALEGADILAPGAELAFLHPLMRAAVYQELSAVARADAHRRAAEALMSEGARPLEVARQLLDAAPSADPQAVANLLQAAAQELATGETGSVVRLLERALVEPAGDRRSEVLHELGRVRLHTGDPEALANLLDARDAAATSEAAAAVGLDLGRALAFSGDGEGAIAALERALRDATGGELRRRLEAEWLYATDGLRPLEERRARAETIAERLESPTRGGRLILAQLATIRAAAGATAPAVAEVARRALDGGRLLDEETAQSPTWSYAVGVLFMAGHHEEAYKEVCRGQAVATERNWQHTQALVGAFRADVALVLGLVAEAEEQARSASALAMTGDSSEIARQLSGIVLCDALVEADALDEAGAAAASARAADLDSAGPLGLRLEHAGARLDLARGAAEQAVRKLERIGESVTATGVDSPAEWAWRTDMVTGLVMMGRVDEARRLAAAELKAARAFGAPRLVGRALEAEGLARGGEEGLTLLQEAVETLADAQAPLARAWAQTTLGSALRRAGQRVEARSALRAALDSAQRMGAKRLERVARGELSASGAKLRREVLSGVDSLTPSERRVAELAAAGRTNREIAGELFLTLRTVEMHLTNAYRKLDGAKRSDLRLLLSE